MTAHELFHAGKLKEATASQIEEVRSHPTDQGARLFLGELFCFAGEYERADTQLDALGHQDPKAMPVAAVFRHLIRAAQARQDFFTSGRVPEFLGRPEGSVKLLLEAAVSLRGGEAGEAGERLAQAEAEWPKVAGTRDGRRFEDFRDLDDLTFAFFEVFTTAGKYYWIPIDRVEQVDFRPPERPRDLLWRPAHMVVRGGPDGEVFVPALYPGAAAEPDENVKLGRVTEWRGGDGSPVRGVGLRTFLVGEEDVPILDITSLAFDTPPG